MKELVNNIELTKSYKTRDGGAVRVFAVDGGGEYPVLGALYDTEDKCWLPESWTAEGASFSGATTAVDLLEVKPEYTRWLIVAAPHGYPSKEAALSAAKTFYSGGGVAVVPVTFRIGDNL